MPKQIDPLQGMISTLGAMTTQAMGGTVPGREDALTTKLSGMTVDTCAAFDTGEWETGVERDGHWVIVEQYPSRAKAQAGHARWVEKLKADPATALADVNPWGL